ncbi:nitric oxide dioxygenase [Ammoniphilus oxalaticus]|uniref:Flavohemoprotein n=1 Tax=Ammoniphilus oxalaticus TaxID=66863 RepID=A0A419SLR7_9BACL|nr:NO-inducible flavohemoprotein [Ammoniphilus oxalaticus]RKD25009.1 nitric oxide dioxygenase [Ammoniphilus oxalaticus]
MLDAKTIEIIKSTVPVLEVHGQAITTRFYELLFTSHPELLHIFNHANQKQGRQQAALANAVYAAAAHIDQLETIVPVVKQIAHKHRSLGVKAEHYPIVGENLLQAIKDVLGDAATDEIIGAWGTAYGVIADVFISVEAGMYTEAEEQAGGWADFRSFRVTNKVKESEVITSFYLKPIDGGALPSFEPGQYVSVKVQPIGEEYTHIRQYSLSEAPGKDYFRLSVRREDAKDDQPQGIVSTYLHNHIEEGDQLQLSAPAGDFFLDTTKKTPVVLLSAGVGLTPLVSMLNTLVDYPDRQVIFIHSTQSGNYHAMKEHVQNVVLENNHIRSFFCYQNPTQADRVTNQFDKEGYIDLGWLQSVLPSNQADFYFCGPVSFMKGIYSALKEWGVPTENIHFEFFGPAADLEELVATN